MDANTIKVLTTLAGNAIHREHAARTALAEAMADMTQGIDPSAIRRVMEAAATALPYRMLMEETGDESEAEVFTRLRKRLTSRVLNSGPSSSSCALTNEAQRLEYAGYRAFLSDTEAFAD
ncbi:hypothetical protein [Streptomyces europaeiscabiei]|uniref:hypothetical protein n=1 Tax=Streptomyces europaeiscabiei TaxID=146819 RepID=UPI002E16532F|nr:hypothetical protein OHB30_33145 [Streptomyces europaeiscabiei]